MLYSLLLTPLQFGATLGGGNFRLRLNGSRPLIDLVMQGLINTDGSEEHVAIHETDGGFAVGPRIPKEDQPFTHTDFQGFQEGRPAAKAPDHFYRFVRAPSSSADEAGS